MPWRWATCGVLIAALHGAADALGGVSSRSLSRTSSLLCDLRTPALLVDVDALQVAGVDPDALAAADDADAVGVADALGGALYIHARIATTAPRGVGLHRDATRPLATLDVALPAGGARLSQSLSLLSSLSSLSARSVLFGERRRGVDRTSRAESEPVLSHPDGSCSSPTTSHSLRSR